MRTSARWRESTALDRKQTRVPIPALRLYGLRHTWATRGTMAGIDLVTLSAMLGRSRITARLEKLISSQEDTNESDPTVTQVQNAG